MNKTPCKRRQGGVSLIVVLILMAVMLFGGLTMARVGESANLIAGNTATRQAALHASEAGLSDGFSQLLALAAEDTSVPAAGYFAVRQHEDANGRLDQFDWNTVPASTVGGYEVRHIVERLCSGPLPVTDPDQQCLVRELGSDSSVKAGADVLQGAKGKQYRVTVEVRGPKNTQVLVQNLVIR